MGRVEEVRSEHGSVNHAGQAAHELRMQTPSPLSSSIFSRRLSLKSALAIGTALGAVIGLPVNPALAADECGAASPLGVATCDNALDNPYAAGITYNSPTHTVNVGTGIEVNRSTGLDFNGVTLVGGAGALTVNLAEGVIITTEGLRADGVEVRGTGNISITSGADISVNATSADGSGTNGLFGWNMGGVGDIVISQLENSTITVTGDEGSGIFGLNQGSGSIVLTSAGTISTAGLLGYGLNAMSYPGGGGDTTVILTETGSILTDGRRSAGLYSLNYGTGDAIAIAHGAITTRQYSSDGILADINSATSAGNALVTVSDTANIHTIGDESNGAWALNWGLGRAEISSAATVVTDGIAANGLHSNIRNAGSTAAATIDLVGNGSVVTNGELAHGIHARNIGSGAADMTMGSGTSIQTHGNRANGVNGLSVGGSTSFLQASGAVITATGQQAFGVNLEGQTTASADLRGTVTSTGEFGVGAATFATAGAADMVIDAATVVTGGWQADVASLGADTARPSAGVLMGSGVSSQLTVRGIIGAGSDRAIADIGRQAATPGNLTVDSTGLVTGFIELAGGGTNTYNNNAGGLFDVRHFADTDGDGTRDTKRVSISDFGAASSSFNNLAAGIVRLAPVTGETTVDATDYYLLTTGIDSRPLEASYYTLDRAGVVQGQFTNLGTFSNAGVLDLRGSATGNTLVMTGNAAAGGAAGNGVFVSDGGWLLLNTVFNAGVPDGGRTGSFSDALVVDGTALGTGATTIAIDRREGAGAWTPGNGILVVEVRDKAASADDAFVLNGDFVVDGEQAIVGGAHRYALFHNGVMGDIADGNWYLRNIGLSPTVPVYEDYPKVLQPLIDVPTLQQRVGNRYWNDPTPRTPQTVFCKDPSQNFQCVVTDDQAEYYLSDDSRTVIETNGIWGRIEGAHGHFEPSTSTSDARYDNNIWAMQAGLDGLLSESDRGKLIGGLSVRYGQGSANITGPDSRGSINSDAYSLGGTLTWYDTSGFYVDGQAQATWLDSDLSSATLGRTLVDGNNGFGYALSVEAGSRIEMDTHWTLTPQVQLTYTNVRFDSFTDPFGARVSLRDGDSLRGRLGLATEYQTRWKEDDGTVSRFSGYGLANLYNEFLNGTRVSISGVDAVSRDDRLWGGLGLGGSYNWNDDKYSIYGEVSAQTGLAHFGDSVSIGGTLGLRVKW